jgi:hypothetical protein
MLEAHAVKRKYKFEDMKINQIKKFDYADYGKLRFAVFAANKRGDGSFICRVIMDGDDKKVAVQRVK